MTTAALSAPAPRALPEAPGGRKARGRWPWIALALVLVAAAASGAVVLLRRRATPAAHYLTGRVTRGALRESIRATGTVQPVLQVQVGAQVSGRITRVAVDYNSRVRQGDLLAELDATPYREQFAQGHAVLLSARAQLAQNRANLALAERNLERARVLRERGLNAAVDLDAAVGARDAAHASVGVAEAQIAQAEATLDVARTNLGYTRILAPIDGVVATRSVDPGQTVAASFQTPTLFVIANDLTRMQVLAAVDEANVGKLTEGMAATARVDAFPQLSFRGAVDTLRINPTTTNGVVTYQAVINVENPAGHLRPGMTATVTVVTAERADVLRVPNAALRYRPQGAAQDGASEGADGPARGTVYVLSQGRASAVAVAVGVTDGTLTEVSGAGLSAGSELVLDETDAAGGAATTSRQGMRMRMF